MASDIHPDPDPPIAVIGMSCRFPGADGPEEFWDLLRTGTDAVREVPPSRFAEPSERPRRAGFLDAVEEFDAAFFGLSPREAAVVDPQQRLALELAWEALELAGLPPRGLADSRTGVFVGAIGDDYARLTDRSGPSAVTEHTLTGLHRSVIANRISYVLGLRGPSLVVDSGQSSSLVAVQLACESLRRGESDLALAGGVSLNLVPEGFLVVDRFGGLSPSGHSYTFDARADGYVRGEGGGLVVLKPLDRALVDGDYVHCVIRGGAVNNDGGGSSLTSPSGPAQERLLREAYERAGVAPAAVRFVELHGTGTPVGDPVEAGALGAVLGVARPAGTPLLVGSVKTNIGHLEGAAGIAGLIKAALCVEHRTVVPSLNFTSARIPLDALGLQVNQVVRELEAGPVVAGVSSFGVGGTNCHLVLTEPPTGAGSTDSDRPHVVPRVPLPVLVSGRDEAALRAQAQRLLAHLDRNPGLGLGDVAHSAATTRSYLDHRAAVLAADGGGLAGGLSALAAGETPAGVVRGIPAAPGRTVFVFPGQGSQWVGMAVELLDSSPPFRARFDECATALAPFVDQPLAAALSDPTQLDRVEVVQPLLWAVMVSLAEVWRGAGVEPAAVVGHSQGEIAAACVAGALSLSDGARVVALRSRAGRRQAGRLRRHGVAGAAGGRGPGPARAVG